MDMNRLNVLISCVLAFLIGGCAIFATGEREIVAPTVVEKAAFPLPPQNFPEGDFYLKADLVISRDGAVKNVRLLNSSGDSKWDSAATETLMHWKYSPGMQNNKPIRMNIIQVTHVVSTPPLLVHLAQILFPTKAQADSALTRLRTGADFDSLAEIYSIPNSVLHSGDMGLVDINVFERDIQNRLLELQPERYTPVLALGPYYVIFERVK